MSRGLPAPPATLQCNLRALKKGDVLHRIHDADFDGNSFNPGFGSSRFAPFSAGGTPVPTAYVATSLACAIFETIFHDINPKKPFKSVRFSKIEHLAYSVIQLDRDLGLAQLFNPDLMKWKISRALLIDTPKSHYLKSRTWSEPIHQSPQEPEGMVWTSRAFDEEQAMMLFGSRVASKDLKVLSTVKVTSDPACWQKVQDEADRADILIAR